MFSEGRGGTGGGVSEGEGGGRLIGGVNREEGRKGWRVDQETEGGVPDFNY